MKNLTKNEINLAVREVEENEEVEKEFNDLLNSFMKEFDIKTKDYYTEKDFFQYEGKNFSKDLIRKYQDKVSWYNISRHNINLDEQFLIEFVHQINWEDIFMNGLKKELVNENLLNEIFHLIDKKYIPYICFRVPLSEEFIEKFQSIIDWKNVVRGSRNVISINFIEKHLKKGNLNLEDILINIRNINLDFLIKYEKEIDNVKFGWQYVFENQYTLSNELVDKYGDKLSIDWWHWYNEENEIEE